MEQRFDDMRPYTDEEIPAAVQRIVDNPYFPAICAYLFPKEPVENVRQLCLSVTTADAFQSLVMSRVVKSILDQTTEGVTALNFDKIDDSRKSIFICNHRDILLDAAMVQYFLYENHKAFSEITFGSNLMKGDLVIDIGKVNRMFRIMRGGNMRDFYKQSIEVSAYMRYAILEKNRSVWIAQRNGRTKDGNDKTEMAVLKMFALSSDKPFVENLNELNITPIVVSYEYDPCDFLKTQEVFVSRYQRYEKAPNEDLMSILHGITQPKGHVQLVVAPSVSEAELKFCDQFEKNHKFSKLASMIDLRVYENYKLWKTNYIAYDLLNKSYKYADHYDENDKKHFIDYMENGLKDVVGETDELREIFLGIYANPVANRELNFI